MGQKVSPVGLRVGIIRDWEARWYADKNDVADLLHEDLKIRELLEDQRPHLARCTHRQARYGIRTR